MTEEFKWWNHLPDDVDTMWAVINGFLHSLPADQRTKARKVLMRRLMHPEGRQNGIAVAQRDLEREKNAVRARPRPLPSPLCMCGSPKSLHDPLTGEKEGCEMFTPMPN